MTFKRASKVAKVSLSKFCLACERESRSGEPDLRLSVRDCDRDNPCHLSVNLRVLAACFFNSASDSFSSAGDWLATTSANSGLVQRLRISSWDKDIKLLLKSW